MQIIFEAIVIVCFAIALWKVNKYFCGFLLISAFSMFYPVYGKMSWLAFHSVWYGILFYYFLVVYYPRNQIQVLLNALCLICIVHAIFQVVQMLNIHFIVAPLDDKFYSYPGLMANRNETSALVAFCFPAFLRRKWWYLIPFPVFSLIAAKSFGGPFALICGLFLVVCFKYPRSWLLVILLALGLLYMELVDSPGTQARLKVWSDGLQFALQRPITGAGIGHWRLMGFNYTPTQIFFNAHNEYLQCFFEMGFLPIILIGAYLVSALRQIRLHSIPVLAIIIVAINSVYNFPFHIAPTAMVALTWMVILEVKLYDGRRLSANKV